MTTKKYTHLDFNESYSRYWDGCCQQQLKYSNKIVEYPEPADIEGKYKEKMRANQTTNNTISNEFEDSGTSSTKSHQKLLTENYNNSNESNDNEEDLLTSYNNSDKKKSNKKNRKHSHSSNLAVKITLKESSLSALDSRKTNHTTNYQDICPNIHKNLLEQAFDQTTEKINDKTKTNTATTSYANQIAPNFEKLTKYQSLTQNSSINSSVKFFEKDNNNYYCDRTKDKNAVNNYCQEKKSNLVSVRNNLDNNKKYRSHSGTDVTHIFDDSSLYKLPVPQLNKRKSVIIPQPRESHLPGDPEDNNKNRRDSRFLRSRQTFHGNTALSGISTNHRKNQADNRKNPRQNLNRRESKFHQNETCIGMFKFRKVLLDERRLYMNYAAILHSLTIIIVFLMAHFETSDAIVIYFKERNATQIASKFQSEMNRAHSLKVDEDGDGHGDEFEFNRTEVMSNFGGMNSFINRKAVTEAMEILDDHGDHHEANGKLSCNSKHNRPRDSIQYLGMLLTVISFNLAAIHILSYRNFLKLISVTNSADPEKMSGLWREPKFLLVCIVEITISLVHPFCYIDGVNFCTWPALYFSSLMRIPFLVKLFYLKSPLLASSTNEMIASLNDIHLTNAYLANIMTAIKVAGEKWTYQIFALQGMFIWFISAWLLSLSEARHGLHECTLHKDDVHYKIRDTLWMIPVTMMTVGYGDMVPVSLEGKAICILVGAYGLVISAKMVLIHAEKTKMTKRERIIYNQICKRELNQKLRLAAVIFIQRVWRNRRKKKRFEGFSSFCCLNVASTSDKENCITKSNSNSNKCCEILNRRSNSQIPTHRRLSSDNTTTPEAQRSANNLDISENQLRLSIPTPENRSAENSFLQQQHNAQENSESRNLNSRNSNLGHNWFELQKIDNSSILLAMMNFKKVRMENKYRLSDTVDLTDIGIRQENMEREIGKINNKLDMLLEIFHDRILETTKYKNNSTFQNYPRIAQVRKSTRRNKKYKPCRSPYSVKM